MAGRSYIILREDGLAIHTKPIARDEAEWLLKEAYYDVKDRAARIRYLSEYGKVLDVVEGTERLGRLKQARIDERDVGLFFNFTGIYESPEEFKTALDRLLGSLGIGIFGIEGLQPEVRRALDEFVSEVKEFLRRPARPRPPEDRLVRYLEASKPLLKRNGELRKGVPRPEWYSYKVPSVELGIAIGVSVYKDEIWLWEQCDHTEAIVIKRGAGANDVVAAITNDDTLAKFAKLYIARFGQIVDENEDKLRSLGYGDVVDIVRAIRAALAPPSAETASAKEEEAEEEEERINYIVFRDDGLIIHAKPITWHEADWLFNNAYNGIDDRDLRIKYLSEWGNVLDAEDFAVVMDRLKQIDADLYYDIHYSLPLISASADDFNARLNRVLRRKNLPPEVRQALEDVANKVNEFLQRPVEPISLDALPARYMETPYGHLQYSGGKEHTVPEAEWFAFMEPECKDSCVGERGVSIFKDAVWLWKQEFLGTRSQVVVVRRDVTKDEAVEAILNDSVALGFLKENVEVFKKIIDENEDKLRSLGYGDVVDKVKELIAVAAAQQLPKQAEKKRSYEDESRLLPA